MNLRPKSFIERIDWLLVALYFLLVFIGLMSIYSIEHRTSDEHFIMMNSTYGKQIIMWAIGLFLALIVILTDSKFITSSAYLSFFIGVLLLILVLLVGRSVNGSRSFLLLGPIQIQPAELVKLFTALAISKFLSSTETNFSTLRHRLICAAFALVPMVIIILQKETGLALVYLSFFLAMYREGLPSIIITIGFSVLVLTIATLLIPKTILFIILTILAIGFLFLFRKKLKRDKNILIIVGGIWLIGVLFSQVLVPVIFTKVLKNYQVQRIYTMIGQDVPEAYAKGINVQKQSASEYNVSQSKIAIASGGFLGKGFGNGAQTKYNWVPEQRTDFIFCTIGEQFGFLGSFILVLLYVIILLRIIFIAERQRSQFSRVFAYCFAGILLFHVLINLGMTIGLAPVIGIPLPFISAGGTSLITFTLLFFILLRLDADRQMVLR